MDRRLPFTSHLLFKGLEAIRIHFSYLGKVRESPVGFLTLVVHFHQEFKSLTFEDVEVDRGRLQLSGKASVSPRV